MKSLVITVIVIFLIIGAGLTLPGGSAASAGSQQQPAKTTPAKSTLKPEDLDRLLAPIALYPDQLLAQMLLCAANPGKVGALDEWLASQQNAQGQRPAGCRHQVGIRRRASSRSCSSPTSSARWPARSSGRRSSARRSPRTDRRSSPASSGCGRRRRTAGTLKSTPQQEVETKTTSIGRAGDRHRAGQPAGRVRAAIQPAGRLHHAVIDGRHAGETTAPRPSRRA